MSAVTDFRSIADRLSRSQVHKMTRFTCQKGEPGFKDYCDVVASGKRVEVYLNGVFQNHCETADSRGGWIVRAKMDEAGQLYADGDHVAQERVFGVVEIRVV